MSGHFWHSLSFQAHLTQASKSHSADKRFSLTVARTAFSRCPEQHQSYEQHGALQGFCFLSTPFLSFYRTATIYTLGKEGVSSGANTPPGVQEFAGAFQLVSR